MNRNPGGLSERSARGCGQLHLWETITALDSTIKYNLDPLLSISYRSAMVDDKYIGLALAITSTLAIGTSFVITKKGLNDAADKHGFEGDGFAYLKTPLWWAGIGSLVVGEIANFAAYAFAPAILVTPLGALSVLIGAVLGSYFLKEELGILGKLGCAICLLGSVVIVLHAPPDQPIETVDEILNDALSIGKAGSVAFEGPAADFNRIYHILPCGGSFFVRDDIQGRAYLRQAKSADIRVDMLDCRIYISNVSQGIWHCLEIDSCGSESIYPSIYIRFCNCMCGVYSNTDELLQQSSKPIFDLNRQPSILCHIYNSDTMCVVHFVQRLQHYRCRQHDILAVWILGNFRWCVFAQPVPRRSGRSSNVEGQIIRRRWDTYRSTFKLLVASEYAIEKKFRPSSKKQ